MQLVKLKRKIQQQQNIFIPTGAFQSQIGTQKIQKHKLKLI
jgi:5-formaminoimidazole-4-carboxamide-1-beta-D-ribofuranosyl 5'-monophosphate synthetase